MITNFSEVIGGKKMSRKHWQNSFIVFASLAGLGFGSLLVLADKPTVTRVQTRQLNLSLTTYERESYEDFLLRVEALAKENLNVLFQQNPSLQAVKILISGENQGLIAPVLSVSVSRQNWLMRPYVRTWGNYYENSKLLLGFGRSPSSTPLTPPVTTNPTETPTPTPSPEVIPPIYAGPDPDPENSPSAPIPTERLREAGKTPPPSAEDDI